jgi:putative transposase
MAYVRIWVHLVWGTKHRDPTLEKENRFNLFQHIRENAQSKGIYLDFINGHKDHVHALISLDAEQTMAKTVQLMKGESSFWANKNNIFKHKLAWADEYYAVSVSESMVDKVRNYIKNQEEHHKTKTFEDECEEFIQKYGFTKLRG